MKNKTLSLYGLKWNPFGEIPVDGLWITPALDTFCWRTENLAREGGFALVTGEPGIGKSAALRVLVHRLGQLRDVVVGVLTRPQSGLCDFYRELGELFRVPLSPHNRWAGTKVLRDRWAAHLENALYRPVLVVDEAQDMKPVVLNELRLLSSVELDSRSLLTVVLAGDSRLVAKLRHEDLLPLGSRIRVRWNYESATPKELLECLRHTLTAAGNPRLMTAELMQTLCEHAAGNHRVLATMGAQLLDAAAHQEAKQIDEKLYFELFQIPGSSDRSRAKSAQARAR